VNNNKLEPKRLKDGKKIHKLIQAEWETDAKGEKRPGITREKSLMKPNGRRGRMDIHVEADEKLSAIVEIKDSNWDVMTLKAVRRNARRYARQLWSYIEAELDAGKEVSPGVEFSRTPRELERVQLIESIFDEYGIPVVWNDAR